MTEEMTAGTQSSHADHRALKAKLHDLVTEPHMDEVIGQLASLVPFLKEHFEMEESPDGFFEQIVRNAPRHANAVDELQAEHEETMRRATQLLERGRELLASQARLREEIAAFVRQVRRHERTETELLFDSLEVDIGVGD